MRSRVLLPLLLAPLILLACTTSQAADDPGGVVAGATIDEAAASPTPNIIRQAEEIIGEGFQGRGWIERIVRMDYAEDGVLRVILDQPTNTLSQLDSYTQMCHALSALVTSEENTTNVLAVQFFKADGMPMVGTSAPDTACARF